MLAALLGACQGQTSRKPPVHLNLNMDFQHRVDPQEGEAFWPDHRGIRTAPAGTVPTTLADDDEFLRADDHLYRGVVDGRFASSLPPSIPLDAKLLARGRERFHIYCAPCHDDAGTGHGIVTKKGLMNPPSYNDDRLRARPVGYFFRVASDGIRTMSGYAAQIPVRDRWAIAAWIKTLQVSQGAEAAWLPSDAVDKARNAKTQGGRTP